MTGNETLVNAVGAGRISGDSTVWDGTIEAPTTIITNKPLDQGYVPANEIKRSVEKWEDIPVTSGHPTDPSGNLVEAKNRPYLAIGRIRDPELREVGNSVYIDAEMHLDPEKAGIVGPEATEMVKKIKNGEQLEVSTSYHGTPMDSGVYDGEHHDEVMGNLQPDHLALLPEGTKGKCSIADGCKAGGTATATAANQNTMTQSVNDVPDGAVLNKAKVRNRLIDRNDFSASEENSVFLMSEDELIQTANKTDVNISDFIDTDLSGWENRSSKRIEMKDAQSQNSTAQNETDLSGWENRASKRLEMED